MNYSKKTISILITPSVKEDIEEVYRRDGCKSFSCLLEDLLIIGLQQYELAQGEFE